MHACTANATLGNIPFLFLSFLCHPYIFTIFVENFYCSLVHIIVMAYIVGCHVLTPSTPDDGLVLAETCPWCVVCIGVVRVMYWREW